MIWPWVSRRRFDAAENLRLAAENLRIEGARLLAASEVARQQQFEAHEREVKDLRDRVTALEAERKALVDRIVQLSGQPALYEKQVAIPSPENATDQLSPRTVTTFSDVHAAVREAMKSNTFDVLKGRTN